VRLPKGTGHILRPVISTLGDDRLEIGVECLDIGEVVKENAVVVPVVAIAHKGHFNIGVRMLVLDIANDTQDFLACCPNPRLHRRRAVHHEAEFDLECVHLS
jgi:hypothetical protein